jgi:hypothetical protein
MAGKPTQYSKGAMMINKWIFAITGLFWGLLFGSEHHVWAGVGLGTIWLVLALVEKYL